MSGGHAHALHLHGHSHLHRLAPEVKIAAMFGGLLAIVLTPREQFWAFGIYGLAIIGSRSKRHSSRSLRFSRFSGVGPRWSLDRSTFRSKAHGRPGTFSPRRRSASR